MNHVPRPAAFVSAPPRTVAFVCVHNSARSQLAEGLARALAPEGTRIFSAGSTPSRVHPMAVEVMREAGFDIGAQQSKGLEAVPWPEVDTVVTLCGEADETCPVVGPAVRRLHWPLPDPASAPESGKLEAFREARDEIRWRVSALWPGGA